MDQVCVWGKKIPVRFVLSTEEELDAAHQAARALGISDKNVRWALELAALRHYCEQNGSNGMRVQRVKWDEGEKSSHRATCIHTRVE